MTLTKKALTDGTSKSLTRRALAPGEHRMGRRRWSDGLPWRRKRVWSSELAATDPDAEARMLSGIPAPGNWWEHW